MPGSRNRHHRRSSSSDSSDWSCSSDCSSDRKRSRSPECKRNRSPDCKPKRERSKSPECKRNRSPDCKPKRERSRSPKHSSEVESYSNDKECKPHHDSDCEKKHSFNDIYNYFKNRLFEDEQLMVGGSSAYINSINDVGQIVPTNYAVDFNKTLLNYNVEIVYPESPFYVRESGVYILFFIAQTDSSSQFTVFVNGVLRPNTTVGSNSGAGQVISRHMLHLENNDNLVIRNYISTANSVTLNSTHGGLQKGCDTTFLLMKIAPLNPANFNPKLLECLSRHKKHLFHKITEHLLMDNQLMLRGFNVHGTFYNTMSQVVATESDVVFNATSNVSELMQVSPTQIKVLEDGVYKLFFITNTTTSAQFAMTVNNVPVDSTIQGLNQGAGQISLRALLELRKNDIVTVRNHTSANGSVVISENAGGSQNSLDAILTVFKIAPLSKWVHTPVNCKVEEHYKCYYEKFRNYLLSKWKLQIAGSPAYLSVSSDITQTLALNDSLHFSNKLINRNIEFIPGSTNVLIRQDGVYDLFADLSADEPTQITVFVNGVADLSTTFGRDSGAARTLLRQFLSLKKGDIVSVRNYSSHANPFHISENAGGNYIGQNVMFMLFMLSPLPCLPMPQ